MIKLSAMLFSATLAMTATANAQSSLSAWQRATYDAIRSTGNNNPILIEPGGSRSWNLVQPLNQSVYTSMKNIIMDPHIYGFQVDFSTDQAKNDANVEAMVAAAQTIKTADGTPAVILAEYGNSTNGDSIDPNGEQSVAAVINAGSKGLVGSAAWHWKPGGNADHLLDGNGQPSKPFGQLVQLFINTDIVPPTACQANTKAIQTLSTIQDTLTQTDSGTSTPTLTEAEAQKQTDALQTQLDALNALLATMRKAQ